MKGQKSTERWVDQFKFVGLLSLSEFSNGTIPPDIDASKLQNAQIKKL